VRMMVSCEDSLADSPWVEWPDFVQTWPEPAQAPTNFTLVELTAYNVTFTFEPGLGLDCTWASWKVQILQGISDPTSEHWTDLTECENEMQFRENLTCTVTGLLSNTPYQVRVRETCTNYIYDSGWGYSPQFYSSMPVQAGLPQAFAVVENSVTAFFFDVTWVAGPAGQCVFKEWVMEVYQSSPEMGDWALPPLVQLLDDSQTWVEHKCLASRAAPLCRPGDLPRSLKQNSTYAVRVKESCTDPNADGDFVMLDFNVTTSIALEPAEAPDNLTISNETAYTFLLEFDAGAPHDCYFTGWHVEIRENWTEGNYSNETNFTELNYSLWVPREECKEEDIFPRDRMRCIVPRLRKHSLYDAKVRETCYEGYTEALDSGFSPDLPDRQAETQVPEAATTPFGLAASSPGPYGFSLHWSAGDPKDCLYEKWLVEIKDENYTGGQWLEAIECGREPRETTSCTITMLHEGYLGEEAHLRSDTEYGVRVTEFCETYTSIYEPWGGSRERAAYLDSPIYYLPTDSLPRTLVPVPTLTPTNFQVFDIDHQTFRLSWEAPVSNDCRFRNWTVEIRLIIHCVSGNGYTNCTAVEDQPWTVPSSCVIEDRSITTCQVHDVMSYAFYDVRMRERCSDATAESGDASLVAEIWPFLADTPENMTVTSPGPFTLNVKWDPGLAEECVFSHWDVQVQVRRFGDLEDRFSRASVSEKWYGEILDLVNDSAYLNWSSTVASCRLEGQREVAECNISSLVSNALYDVRIAERCVDSRADSYWLVKRLQATIPAWAETPLGPNVSNVSTTFVDLEWAASEPRDCLFSSWKVEVKPVAIIDDDWIPVPECSLPDRGATSCSIVGLQSYTSYDLRIQETCIHNTSDSPYLLDVNSFTTEVGQVVYVGTNPDTNSKAIYFGSQGLNACAYHTKCCRDEFSLCYSTDQVDVIRTDLTDAGWGQDLYLSCVADAVSQDQMKRIVARPPATLEAVGRTANSLALVWLPYGSGGYMSDCYCSVWNIFMRRKGTTEWLLSPDCNNMPFAQSSCTAQTLEGNWLFPNTVYEIRVRQTCSFDRLSSPYEEIEVSTLPGCTFSQHSGRDDYFVCADGFESNIFEGGRFDGDGIGCWRRGGRAVCAKNFPYMCASPDSCAKVTSTLEGGVRADHCCMSEPCGTRNGGDRECIVRPLAPSDIVVTSSTPDSLTIDWKEQDFVDTTYYPCTFRRWQVDLSEYYFEHWSSEWRAAPECYLGDRRTTVCTVTGLPSNARFQVRIREVCDDETLNGDYEQYPTLAQVNPLPAGPVSDVTAQREVFWLLVQWTAGSLNDCVHLAWRIMATSGAESHVFTTEGQARENSFVNMTGLTDGTIYQVSVQETCENTLADSEVVSASISTRPEAAGTPLQPLVMAAGPYWLYVEWQPGQKGKCDFLYWDVEARKTGTELWQESPLCTERSESTPSCNITETFSCYKNKFYTGFYSVCIPGVECPMTNVATANDCKVACSNQSACRALRFQAAYNYCWLVDSSYNQLDDDPLHETTGCARHLGLESLTGYELEVAQRCTDPEADSGWAVVLAGDAPNHTTIAPATQPENVAVQSVAGRNIRLTFTPGALRDYMPIRADGLRYEMDDSTDCEFVHWEFQVMLNQSEAPSNGPAPCWQYPMVCDQVWHTVPSSCASSLRETEWCELHVIWSDELYQLRMREDCVDPTADSPFTVEPIWVVSGLAVPAAPVENFTGEAGRMGHNVSATLDWDVGADNDCVFTGWQLQLRSGDGPWQEVPECVNSVKDEVNCTITEGIESQTTYDARVRAYCLDPLAQSNWTEIWALFATPAIPAEPPLVSLTARGPHEMWFSLQPQEPWDCVHQSFVAEFRKVSEEAPQAEDALESSDLESANESVLCLPAVRAPAQCLLQGLVSNTTYYVRICESCADSEAEACGDASDTTWMQSPSSPGSVQLQYRARSLAMVSFMSPTEPGNCLSEGWALEYLNETEQTWHPLDTCPRAPGVVLQQCSVDIHSLVPEYEYWLRVREVCLGLSAPSVSFFLPALEVTTTEPVAMDLESNVSNMSNESEMEDMWELDGEENYSNASANASFSSFASYASYAGNASNAGNAGNASNASNASADNEDDEANESFENWSNSSNASSVVDENTQEMQSMAETRSSCSGTCVWTLGPWSACSSGCGEGLQSREVHCPSSSLEDCPKPVPESTVACTSTAECSWVSSWGECSATCGAGVQVQQWSCPSGSASDCGTAPASSEQSCYATIGCEWLASDWTACSVQCGFGTRERTVTCSSGVEADCAGARPDSTEVCHEVSECNWAAGAWGACSSSCGDGFRAREVSCSSGAASDCAALEVPASAEPCREVRGQGDRSP
ncbi:unnamed protein product, partial [Effrenium voratum]